ncbi:MAG TPA: putative sulfate exporter family transporter [Puia sp.]|nr:putative sulfate exporter family transporter [Puia sp.]
MGAAGRYGPEALQIAMTVKLVRALWIIPVSLPAAVFFNRKGRAAAGDRVRIRIPYFS